MFYTDNCCCCVELKCGCILIAIFDVILRGIDRFLLDGNSLMGNIALVVSGIYLISCIILLIGALLGIRYLLLPYIFVVMVHVIILIWECGYVIMMDDFYDFIIFDIIQAVVSLYFCLVVYSYYDTI
ncbi:uncharacterized protein LOC108653766 [Drosophila navojoa]|uniref:uncharacterized protein LOC108653766 n=1 Tax=Drosophila navojoa TaxID=7232 RepID=UPI000846B13E|nr:uncharacterized protein LOC108653766 [Drosophila navojoa]